jgi:virginiamycin B lyase
MRWRWSLAALVLTVVSLSAASRNLSVAAAEPPVAQPAVETVPGSAAGRSADAFVPWTGPLVPVGPQPMPRVQRGDLTEFTLIQDDGDVPALGAVTIGPDGAFWSYGFRQLLRITVDGQIGAVPIDYESDPLTGFAAGPDRALWFTTQPREGNGQVVRLAMDGSRTTFPLPSRSVRLGRIINGPDGALWFTEGVDRVARITTDGRLREFAQPWPGDCAQCLESLLVGPDGALWLALPLSHRIGRMTLDGVWTYFVLPPGADPGPLVVGPDGALWFTLPPSLQKLGRITTDGQLSAISLSGLAGKVPLGVVAGDNALWWLESSGRTVGRIGLDGVLAEIPLGNEAEDLMDNAGQQLLRGPDGAMWYFAILSHFIPNGGGRVENGMLIPLPNIYGAVLGRLGERRASDGQSLLSQPTAVQGLFRAVWGDAAAAHWVTEHERELAAPPPAEPLPARGLPLIPLTGSASTATHRPPLTPDRPTLIPFVTVCPTTGCEVDLAAPTCQTARAEVRPAQGVPGSRFTIHATGFQPSSTVTLAITGPESLGPTPTIADVACQVTETVAVEVGDPLGSYLVQFTGTGVDGSPLVLHADFHVVATLP